ncbi:MAG: 30S ribosomal protein S17 [Phycisphaeraceae bacterium]|nr:30S ribosomal protein S17 [Phycisphaerae bacterium]MBX3391382.1 30S ribosomal protein S17 [Phycisphaeraceae bacterium]
MTTSTRSNPTPSTTADAVSHKGTRVGVVETDGRSKTRKVVVAYMARHPKYGKFIRQRTVLHVHDENNESHTGDVVEVAHCRPISKTKSWKLVRIVERRSDLAAALASAKSIARENQANRKQEEQAAAHPA